MTFIEFIGFLITLVAFFFLIIKQAFEDRKRRKMPEEEEDTEEEMSREDLLKEALQSYGLEIGREKGVSKEKISKKTKKGPSLTSAVDRVKKEQVMHKPSPELYPEVLVPVKEEAFQDVWTEHGAYELKKGTISRAKQVMGRKGYSLQNALLAREILGPPKASLPPWKE